MLVLQTGELLSLISRTYLFRETGQCAWVVKMNVALGCDARQAPLALSGARTGTVSQTSVLLGLVLCSGVSDTYQRTKIL